MLIIRHRIYEFEYLASKQDFLGLHFRIQAPLQVQDYQPVEGCIANWVVLAPTDESAPSELRAAANQFSEWYLNWRNNSNFKPLVDIPSLRAWLGVATEDKTPTALFMLAHHDNRSVYFTTAPRFGAFEIGRDTRPALAVINACGDAAPGSSQVVQQLNLKGVTGMIATATKVDPYLAGDFFATLGKVIQEKQGAAGYPIGLAYFETIQKLSKMQSSNPTNRQQRTYGAKALAYEILGNSDLHVCSPSGQ